MNEEAAYGFRWIWLRQVQRPLRSGYSGSGCRFVTKLAIEKEGLLESMRGIFCCKSALED